MNGDSSDQNRQAPDDGAGATGRGSDAPLAVHSQRTDSEDHYEVLQALIRIAQGKSGSRGPINSHDAQRIARDALLRIGMEW